MDFRLPHTQTPCSILPVGTRGAKTVEASQQKQPRCLHRGQCSSSPQRCGRFELSPAQTSSSHDKRSAAKGSGNEGNSTRHLVIGQEVWRRSCYRSHVFECTGFSWLLACSKTEILNSYCSNNKDQCLFKQHIHIDFECTTQQDYQPPSLLNLIVLFYPQMMNLLV